jgi:hypothetical protein
MGQLCRGMDKMPDFPPFFLTDFLQNTGQKTLTKAKFKCYNNIEIDQKLQLNARAFRVKLWLLFLSHHP